MNAIVNVVNDLVILGEDGEQFTVDCSYFKPPNTDIVMIVDDGSEVWAEEEPFNGRNKDFDKVEYKKIIDEALSLKKINDTPPQETVEDAKKRKIREINQRYSSILTPLVESYPDIETKTWSVQEQEAREFLKDPSYPTPMLSKILEGRNGASGTETMTQLCEAVVRNSDNFKESQFYTGYRQRLEKAIATATTIAEVDEIQWNPTTTN